MQLAGQRTYEIGEDDGEVAGIGRNAVPGDTERGELVVSLLHDSIRVHSRLGPVVGPSLRKTGPGDLETKGGGENGKEKESGCVHCGRESGEKKIVST